MTGQAAGHIGVRIRTARRAKALSQDELAIAIGVRVRTVGRWEQGTSEPQPRHVRELSRHLDCSLRWLLVGETNGDPEPTEVAA